jgi:hypothetical protein
MIISLILLALALAVLSSPVVLIALLKPALMAVEGGSRKPHHIAAALVAWVADLVAAHTVWAWFIGGLEPGEKTISDTLERLSVDASNPNVLYYRALAQYINSISPTKSHIKAVL